MRLVKKAFAKINLTLEILGTRRGDGFHDIATVMHKVESLYDTVTLTFDDALDGILLRCDKDVCAPDDNLAVRAAKAYYAMCGKAAHLCIDLVKHIPAGAGLAGGSADAAAVLDALNEHEKALTDDALHSLAASLGSDIPFCLEKHTTALCTGRGELIRDLPPLDLAGRVTVEVPSMPLSTKGIYGAYDEEHGDDYSKNKSETMAALIEKGAPLSEIVKYMCNDFQPLCEQRCDEIRRIRERMAKEGLASQMSGSGSAVFGIRV